MGGYTLHYVRGSCSLQFASVSSGALHARASGDAPGAAFGGGLGPQRPRLMSLAERAEAQVSWYDRSGRSAM
ncbi:hypothetical protein THAOC_20988 [Thalassiosira oceanica]|uniref:Uncharacterized protein n=1 Tax=Thalassiosira oceanica TaxID=159749 RepID=K0RYJ0_THAOC|nr:hypothetical protein THAOC_20988 [Thalassiosira oceanica]|eukprot:EJK58853.1 hypothetical protein THAOC_20988 [Thalassiosira oceanica]